VKQLLPIDLVVGDRLLPFGRDQPVDELLAERCLDIRMLRWIDQHDAILVEQPLVAFHRYHEIAFVPERYPSAAIGDRIAVHGACCVEGSAHALADLAIPRALVPGEVDPGSRPEGKLGLVGAGAIAARDERRLLLPDRPERGDDVARPPDAGWIA